MLVIDAGHGGRDPGAVSGEFHESDWTLDVAKRVHNELKKYGISSVLTRTGDTTFELNSRCSHIKKLGCKKGISIHLNAATNKTANGFEFIHSIHSNGKFEKILKEEYMKISGLKARPTTIFTKKSGSGDYYGLHRMTGNTRMTIIESAFISNDTDREFVFSEEGKIKVVTAIVHSILRDEGKKVTTTTKEKEHVVTKGDTLYGISKKLGVTVAQVKSKNGLKTDVITIGQKLKY